MQTSVMVMQAPATAETFGNEWAHEPLGCFDQPMVSVSRTAYSLKHARIGTARYAVAVRPQATAALRAAQAALFAPVRTQRHILSTHWSCPMLLAFVCCTCRPVFESTAAPAACSGT